MYKPRRAWGLTPSGAPGRLELELLDLLDAMERRVAQVTQTQAVLS
jgi:hypothetical protein